MAFWMLDDQAPQKGKIKSLTAPILLEGDIEGLAAVGMWALAGATSQAAGSDGMVSLADLVGIVPDRTIAERLAHRLVAAELWHTHGHACPRCEAVPDRHWRFHDWWDLRYKPAAELKLSQAKSKENKRTEVINAVWARDCVDPTAPSRRMQAHCRYCGTLTKRSDRTPDGPQLDHVDPRVAKGARNLVVACGPCNRRKASRTPEEAEMALRPPPRLLVDPAATADAETPAVSPAPATADAETTPVSPAAPAALAVAVSPGAPAAETPAQLPVVEQAPQGAGSGLAPSKSHANPQGPPPRATRGRGPAGAPGSGSGSGLGLGSGEGSGFAGGGSPQPAPARSRRRRGRGSRPRPETISRTPDPHDAGPAPLIYDAPTGGSPWKGWTGPPSPVSEENVCPIHHHHAPCDRCARAQRGETR